MQVYLIKSMVGLIPADERSRNLFFLHYVEIYSIVSLNHIKRRHK